MAERVQAWLEPTGAEVTLVEMAPGRPSVGGRPRQPGRRDRGSCSTATWTRCRSTTRLGRTVDPFGAESSKDGYLYGRGACDMKAGLATQIAVAHHLAAHADEPRRRARPPLRRGRGVRRARLAVAASRPGFTGDSGSSPSRPQLRVAVAERGLAYYTHPHQGAVDPREQGATSGSTPCARLAGPCSTRSPTTTHEITQRSIRCCPGARAPRRWSMAASRRTRSPTTASCCSTAGCCRARRSTGELEAMCARLERHPARRSRLRLRDRAVRVRVRAGRDPRGLAVRRTRRRGRRAVTGARPEIFGTPYASDVRTLVNDAGDRGGHLRPRQRRGVPLRERARVARRGGAGRARDRPGRPLAAAAVSGERWFVFGQRT